MTEEPRLPSVAEMKRSGMSPLEVVHAWRRRPISSRVGSRRLRRRIVIAMYGSWLFYGFYAELRLHLRNNWITAGDALATCLVVITILTAVWLARRTYVNSPDLDDRELDERMVQVRNQAYRRAFQILTVLVVIAWPASLLLSANEPGDPGLGRSLMIYSCAVLLAATLPTALVAWREPDPEP